GGNEVNDAFAPAGALDDEGAAFLVGGQIDGLPLALAKIGVRAEHALQEGMRFLPVHGSGNCGVEKRMSSDQIDIAEPFSLTDPCPGRWPRWGGGRRRYPNRARRAGRFRSA